MSVALDNKLQILVLPGWYPGRLQPSNGDFIREQVSLLRAQGQSIDLVYCDLNIAYLRAGQYTCLNTIQQDQFGNTDFIKTGPFWPKNNSWGLDAWVKTYTNWVTRYVEYKGQPDIIHAHTYLGGLVALKIKKRYRIPTLITEHYTGWIDGSIPEIHRQRGIKAFQSAELITTVSPFLQQKLQSFTSTQVAYIPNFIDTDVFAPGHSSGNDKTISFLCIGDLIPRKQLALALHAFSAVLREKKDVRLTIIGTGPEEKRLRELANALEINTHIDFVGQKDKCTIASYLQNADLLLHPSRLETFGLVIAEALCVGTPVVCFDNGGESAFTELPGIHICGQMDVQSLTAGILTVMQKKQIKKGSLISQKARERFGPGRMSKQLETRYRALLV